MFVDVPLPIELWLLRLFFLMLIQTVDWAPVMVVLTFKHNNMVAARCRYRLSNTELWHFVYSKTPSHPLSKNEPCFLNILFILITCNKLQCSTRRLIECRMISFSRSRLFGSMWIGSLWAVQLCALAICCSRLFNFFVCFFFGFV